MNEMASITDAKSFTRVAGHLLDYARTVGVTLDGKTLKDAGEIIKRGLGSAEVVFALSDEVGRIAARVKQLLSDQRAEPVSPAGKSAGIDELELIRMEIRAAEAALAQYQ
jgi:hypothetical protein